MRNISLIIRQELEKHHDVKKAKWLENYVKHDIKSRGVGIPRKVFGNSSTIHNAGSN
jgi:hypothetical protein